MGDVMKLRTVMCLGAIAPLIAGAVSADDIALDYTWRTVEHDGSLWNVYTVSNTGNTSLLDPHLAPDSEVFKGLGGMGGPVADNSDYGTTWHIQDGYGVPFPLIDNGIAADTQWSVALVWRDNSVDIPLELYFYGGNLPDRIQANTGGYSGPEGEGVYWPNYVPVPEPHTILLLVAGLAGVAAVRGRRPNCA